MSKLDAGGRHLLFLAQQGANDDGWAPVSEMLWPHVSKLPDALIAKEKLADGGRVRLTESGAAVLLYS